jgi:hypothetical protein
MCICSEVKTINLSTQILYQTKLPKNLAVTINFKVVMTAWTWVKYKRAEGQKVLPHCRCRYKKLKKKFPFVTKRGSPAETQSMFGRKCKVRDETPTFFPNKL